MQRTVCSRGGLPKESSANSFLWWGNPTQIDPSLIGQVLETVERVFGMCSDVEITVEANPGSMVDLEKFSHLRSVGCNRLSLGVQSFDNYALKKLGRVHSSEEAIRAFSSAREAGFSNVSIDLIFSVPDVSEPAWKGSVDRAISLQPEHISAYALTIEEGTLFAKREREGMLVVLTEDDDALQYDWTRHRLMDAGFGQHEVSNFAQRARESRHNLGYWTGVEYLGVGLSAHSYIGGERFWNISDIESYLQRVEGVYHRKMDESESMDRLQGESVSGYGLRMSQGVLLTETEQEILRQNCRMASLVDAEFLRLEQDRVVLADSGWSRADGLAVELTDLLEQKPEGTPNVR